MARDLWRSLREKVLPLGDELLVFPAHGAGSPCGGNIGDRDVSSIGYERRFSPKLAAKTEDEFVARVLGDLPDEPFYYKRMKQVNTEGPRILGRLPFLQPIDPRDFRDEMQKSGSVVVDTREITAFGGAHVPNSLSIALRSAFPQWAGWMLQPEQRILLVVDDPKDVEVAQRHLLRVGYDNVIGYLRGGINGWIEEGYDYGTTPQMSIHDLKELVGDGEARIQLVDSRTEAEWRSGHIPGARHIFTPHMADGGLDELDRGRPVAVYCGSGYRATIAASELARHGFDKVYAVPGSMTSWRAADYPLVNR
jgi:hydroxyacylglutathione hydrolase